MVVIGQAGVPQDTVLMVGAKSASCHGMSQRGQFEESD